MSHTYFIQRRFHIGYSLLGRQIRRRIADKHYAEGVFILAFAALSIGLVIVNYLGWALLQSAFWGVSGESAAFAYWIGQICFSLLFFLFCMYGFKPALKISLDPVTGLLLGQGDARTHLPLQTIRSATHISALRFHRHHRKYLATKAYFVKMPASLILLSTDHGPVLVGLPEPEQQELLTLLQPQSEKIVFSTLSPTI